MIKKVLLALSFLLFFLNFGFSYNDGILKIDLPYEDNYGRGFVLSPNDTVLDNYSFNVTLLADCSDCFLEIYSVPGMIIKEKLQFNVSKTYSINVTKTIQDAAGSDYARLQFEVWNRTSPKPVNLSDPSLILYYSFDNDSGNTILDLSNSKNNATIYGSNFSYVTDAVSGKALLLGADTYAQSVLTVPSNVKMISFWMKAIGNNTKGIFALSGGGNSLGYAYLNGRKCYTQGIDVCVADAGKTEYGRWIFVWYRLGNNPTYTNRHYYEDSKGISITQLSSVSSQVYLGRLVNSTNLGANGDLIIDEVVAYNESKTHDQMLEYSGLKKITDGAITFLKNNTIGGQSTIYAITSAPCPGSAISGFSAIMIGNQSAGFYSEKTGLGFGDLGEAVKVNISKFYLSYTKSFADQSVDYRGMMYTAPWNTFETNSFSFQLDNGNKMMILSAEVGSEDNARLVQISAWLEYQTQSASVSKYLFTIKQTSPSNLCINRVDVEASISNGNFSISGFSTQTSGSACNFVANVSNVSYQIPASKLKIRYDVIINTLGINRNAHVKVWPPTLIYKGTIENLNPIQRPVKLAQLTSPIQGTTDSNLCRLNEAYLKFGENKIKIPASPCEVYSDPPANYTGYFEYYNKTFGYPTRLINVSIYTFLNGTVSSNCPTGSSFCFYSIDEKNMSNISTTWYLTTKTKCEKTFNTITQEYEENKEFTQSYSLQNSQSFSLSYLNYPIYDYHLIYGSGNASQPQRSWYALKRNTYYYATSPINVSILSASDSSIINLQVYDQYFNNLPDKSIVISRLYPPYQPVTMVRTGSDGKANVNLQSGVWYLFSIYDENGNLIHEEAKQILQPSLTFKVNLNTSSFNASSYLNTFSACYHPEGNQAKLRCTITNQLQQPINTSFVVKTLSLSPITICSAEQKGTWFASYDCDLSNYTNLAKDFIYEVKQDTMTLQGGSFYVGTYNAEIIPADIGFMVTFLLLVFTILIGVMYGGFFAVFVLLSLVAGGLAFFGIIPFAIAQLMIAINAIMLLIVIWKEGREIV